MNSLQQLIPVACFFFALIVAVLALVEFGAWAALRRRRLQEQPRLAPFRGRGVDVIASASAPSRRTVKALPPAPAPEARKVYCERAL